VKDTLIRFSNLETNQIKIVCVAKSF